MGTEKVQHEYGEDEIQILEGLEAVRKRPGMYIGSTSARGLHHLVYEIVDNSVDEALAGFCDTILVTINKDNSVTVVDNGRGIPVGINHKAGLPAVEVVFTVLHAGGKFGSGGYKVSGGLHGVGASVVNALSNWLEVEICSEGKVYKQRYERGKVVQKLAVIGECDIQKTGTKVTFLPDDTIFDTTVFEYNVLKQRFREMAFLTRGLKIVLRDDREEEPIEKTFHYEGGIKEFVQYLNRSTTPLYEDIIYCEGTVNNVAVEVAMQHNDSYNENTYGFVNNITTPDAVSYTQLDVYKRQHHRCAVLVINLLHLFLLLQHGSLISFISVFLLDRLDLRVHHRGHLRGPLLFDGKRHHTGIHQDRINDDGQSHKTLICSQDIVQHHIDRVHYFTKQRTDLSDDRPVGCSQ